MTSDSADDRAHAIRQEAYGWLIRLQESADTPDLRGEFEAWLFQSPQHQQIWNRVSLIWLSAGEAPTLRKPVSAARHRGALRHPARLVAATCAATLALCLIYIAAPSLILRFEADHRTDIAETRRIALSDGSTVLLAPASAIALDFSQGGRAVRLLAGEAYFDVVPDSARQFHVRSRDVDVAVLGTAFNVRLSEDGTEVGLERGSVNASGTLSGRGFEEILSPGDIVAVDRERGTVSRETIPLDDIGAWRNHRLVAVDATIATVIEQIRRYHSSWIAVPDPGLARQRVTGIFNLSDPDKALAALVAPHGGQVRRVSGLARIVTRY